MNVETLIERLKDYPDPRNTKVKIQISYYSRDVEMYSYLEDVVSIKFERSELEPNAVIIVPRGQ